MKNKNSLIIVLLIIALIGSWGYMFLNKDKDTINSLNPTTNQTENKEEAKENNKTEELKTMEVKTLIDSCSDHLYGKTFTGGSICIKTPYINGETENIKKLNKKILEDLLSNSHSFVAVYPESKINFNYTTITKENVVIIQVYSDNYYRNLYYYDIKNDKELTLGQTAEKLKITDIGDAENYNHLDNPETCEKVFAYIENNNLKIEFEKQTGQCGF